jgi:isopentenyl diphosphate isomerase/L-lactate dehydrogenase-like FMN-dependent dehydrogenase
MDILNLDDLQPLAKEKLSDMVYGYISSGADDEVTLRENQSAYEHIKLRPRMLVDVSNVDLSTEVLGTSIKFPIMLAPVAMHQLVHEEGELATARAAGKLGTLMTLSSMASSSMEEVAEVATGPRWYQLYCLNDREFTKTLIKRAEASGYKALVVTVDTPRLGRREADIRNQFHLPPGVKLKNLEGLPMADLPEEQMASALALYASTMLDRSLTWESLDWMRQTTDLPIIIKGVLTAEDARLAVKHGVDGIMVSNHGGRQLDGVSATIEALPEVVDAVDDKMDVFLDGGIRRGTDVFKALAIGAKAVSIGRPYIWGLALDGEAGVRKVLAMLHEELELAMALSGCPTIADIDSTRIKLP